jgi:hypothetical protein
MDQNIPPPGQAVPSETRGAARKDTVAGFVNAVVSVPDGLASATLAA